MKKVEKEFECIAKFINESRNATIGLMNHASLSTYWTVGAYVSLRTKSGSWGDRTVDALCDYLKTRHPKLRGFSRRQIYNMIAFYDTYSSIEFKNIFDRLRLYEFVQSATAQIENDAIVHSADERIVPAVIVQSLTAQLGGSSAKPHAMPDFLSLATFTNHAEIINRCRSMEDPISERTALKTALTSQMGTNKDKGEECVRLADSGRIVGVMTAEEELEHIKVALKTALKTALIRRPAKVIERMGLLLQQLLRDKDITIVALASLLGASRRTVQEDIAILKNLKVLDRVGPDNGGEWVVLLKC